MHGFFEVRTFSSRSYSFNTRNFRLSIGIHHFTELYFIVLLICCIFFFSFLSFFFFFFFFTNWRFETTLHSASLEAPFFQLHWLNSCLHVTFWNSHNISDFFITIFIVICGQWSLMLLQNSLVKAQMMVRSS